MCTLCVVPDTPYNLHGACAPPDTQPDNHIVKSTVTLVKSANKTARQSIMRVIECWGSWPGTDSVIRIEG